MVLLLNGIVGCSLLESSQNNPAIESKLNPRFLEAGAVGTLALHPERRIVLMNFKTNKFCAEAPTEIGLDQNSFNKLAAALKSSTSDTVEIGGSFGFASNNTVLNQRSQGMQFLAVTMYNNCQMYMNNDNFDKEQLYELQKYTIDKAVELIDKEIEVMYSNGKNPIKYESKNALNGVGKEPVDGKVGTSNKELNSATNK
jgi:hypothetical protein